jgi:DNA-binding winged helix-turn-helix (wHTH) protein
MAHRFSKENQTTVETAYRFGEFALCPRDRMLKKNGAISLPLQPKAFDALLCLVRKANHLVSKQELMETLWPSVHVSAANLTNTIVSLRRVVGHDAIRTVSRHGYRFDLRVECEPGVMRATYEKFARAKELTPQRSVEAMIQARDLYWTCLAENPGFAAAWAWLGRCCWFLGKFTGNSARIVNLTEAAFERALTLDPELACAHQFYTLIQVDTGRADEAMKRLASQLERHPIEPEFFAGLVQVRRFRGLLRESIEAHRRAVNLDPAIVTSVAHTRFALGDYAGAIESYCGRAAYYLDAAAWAALEEPGRAAELLRERLKQMTLSELMSALMRSLLALLEGKRRKALHLMSTADATFDPEVMFYLARQYSFLGSLGKTVEMLKAAANRGFICTPETLRSDPWFAALRRSSQFERVIRDSEVQMARSF